MSTLTDRAIILASVLLVTGLAVVGQAHARTPYHPGMYQTTKGLNGGVYEKDDILIDFRQMEDAQQQEVNRLNSKTVELNKK